MKKRLRSGTLFYGTSGLELAPFFFFVDLKYWNKNSTYFIWRKQPASCREKPRCISKKNFFNTSLKFIHTEIRTQN